MKFLSILLILAIGLAGVFGILAVILEIHTGRPTYEILIKVCYVLIGIIGAVLAWLVYLGGPK